MDQVSSFAETVNNLNYQEAGFNEETRFERIHNIIFDDSLKASKLVAREIANLIMAKARENKPCVLGLATGSSPVKVYEELVRLYREEDLSFRNVITFNLDEYFPMPSDNAQSYHYFMHQHLFDHVDIAPENINIPSGDLDPEEILDYCKEYEAKIERLGGIDFQLLGIGRTGHIGFNEPGSQQTSRTRLITLDHLTRTDASTSFLGVENVPKRAITMGIRSVLEAKRVVLLAWGDNKAPIVKRAVEGEISSKVPASYLQQHPNTTFVLDREAAAHLTRIKTPWLVGSCDWNPELIKKAVVWLCDKTGKSILRLTDADYNEYGMDDLLSQQGSSYDLNIRMFNALQHTITGWPGGKPGADDSNRPERSEPAKKRVLIFSPHPDDDVISMGGTLDRLVEQGNEVHIAYQTSGSIAVSNEEALKYAEVAAELQSDNKLYKELTEYIKVGSSTHVENPKLLTLKRLIREKESLAASRYLKVPEDNLHFLNLPFYETGTIKKNPVGSSDISIMESIIKEVKPHQIYAAGDLADPHGTHKVCLDLLFLALGHLKSEPFMEDCWVWLYRGAWHEWAMHEIDMAVPMSPDQVLKKRKAIFYHQSQKGSVMFQGNDTREFWVRAEERNKSKAAHYQRLGLADYAAMEAFKRYRF